MGVTDVHFTVCNPVLNMVFYINRCQVLEGFERGLTHPC